MPCSTGSSGAKRRLAWPSVPAKLSEQLHHFPVGPHMGSCRSWTQPEELVSLRPTRVGPARREQDAGRTTE